MTTPDPDPRDTPGLERGTGVPPGETPPAEAGTSGLSHPEPETRRGVPSISLVLIVVVALAVGAMFLAMAVALLG